MRRRLLLVVCLVTASLPTLASAAWAEIVEGAYRPDRFSILTWTKSRPLNRLGDDVVRMSSTPALGGHGWVIELRRVDAGSAEGEVRFLRTGRDHGIEVGRIRFDIAAEDYAALIRQIDALLARRDFQRSRVTRDPDGTVTELLVCTDGPGYLTERRVGGKEVWLEGSCGDDHPNQAIAALLQKVVLDHACGWLASDRRCLMEPERRPTP